MGAEKKLHIGNSVLRMFLVGMSLLFQVGWILLAVRVLNENFPWVEMLTRILSVAVILGINSKHTDSAYKMPWIMLIMAAPVMGLSLYLMMGMFGDLGSIGKRLRAVRQVTREKLRKTVPTENISYYLQEHIGCPAYKNTS